MTPIQRKLLAVELKRLDKPGLVACLTELAESIPEVWLHLESRLKLEPRAIGDVVERARSAIARATDFDDRQTNCNFDYDSAAYEQVERCFRQIVKMGDLETAMELAESLLSEGSHQVEMSDEGLMWDEIESCLDIVFNAVARSSMPPEKLLAWAARLEVIDRVGLYSQPQLLWKKSYPAAVWSRVADELIESLAAGQIPDRRISPRRIEAIARHAEDALTRSNRAFEIPDVRAMAAQSDHAKRTRSRRRSR